MSSAAAPRRRPNATGSPPNTTTPRPRPGAEPPTGRPADGVPLWQLVDFDRELTARQRADLEAALEASGLLDALVTAEDTPVAAGHSEGYLRASTPVGGPSLADLLRPDDPENLANAAAIPAARITAVLRSVAVTGDPDTGIPRIGPDGRYAAGVLAGAHTKEHAEYVGATARARRRAARIAACETLLAELAAQFDRVGARPGPYGRRPGRVRRRPRRAAPHHRHHAGPARARPGRGEAARHPRRRRRRPGLVRRVAWPPARSPSAPCAAPRPSTRIETDRVDAVETATRAFESAVRELAARRREHARQTRGRPRRAADRLERRRRGRGGGGGHRTRGAPPARRGGRETCRPCRRPSGPRRRR